MSQDKCGSCGAADVQLWRRYGMFYRPETNRCGPCAEREQGKPREGDSIGWMVPLVCDDDGTPWGFTSVPEGAAEAWRALPVHTGEP